MLSPAMGDDNERFNKENARICSEFEIYPEEKCRDQRQRVTDTIEHWLYTLKAAISFAERGMEIDR
jgi:hypothetical protein